VPVGRITGHCPQVTPAGSGPQPRPFMMSCPTSVTSIVISVRPVSFENAPNVADEARRDWRGAFSARFLAATVPSCRRRPRSPQWPAQCSRAQEQLLGIKLFRAPTELCAPQLAQQDAADDRFARAPRQSRCHAQHAPPERTPSMTNGDRKTEPVASFKSSLVQPRNADGVGALEL
jgi:hypothetical protein